MIGGNFAALNLFEENIDSPIENIHGALIYTASEVFGKARKTKKPWVINDVLDVCARRRRLKKRNDGPVSIALKSIEKSDEEGNRQKKAGSHALILES